jgi:hypothetical protein
MFVSLAGYAVDIRPVRGHVPAVAASSLPAVTVSLNAGLYTYKAVERTPFSVRCAPASRCPRPLTGHTDSPYNGLHMNNGVRSTWPALISGTREGGKPRDKSSATRSHGRVDRPDLIPRLTQETCDNRP